MRVTGGTRIEERTAKDSDPFYATTTAAITRGSLRMKCTDKHSFALNIANLLLSMARAT